jgi:peptidoglycan/LPS O-acetylase OafA/YrhL
MTWLASVLVALAVFAIGGRVTGPAAKALRDDDRLWAVGAGATAAARLFERVRLGFRLELLGITTVLALMVLLANV